ncbi:hypothetical protein L2E82_33583 [Cichorium intybus]|uniref:Uncharacterized protein n=1 Tax=Cichorium intybus TaxID=13427 RepID=A0ACB9BKX3_CICIN|nr:hypothetical protein L2E82_33583 [Cichorium intybus]
MKTQRNLAVHPEKRGLKMEVVEVEVILKSHCLINARSQPVEGPYPRVPAIELEVQEIRRRKRNGNPVKKLINARSQPVEGPYPRVPAIELEVQEIRRRKRNGNPVKKINFLKKEERSSTLNSELNPNYQTKGVLGLIWWTRPHPVYLQSN